MGKVGYTCSDTCGRQQWGIRGLRLGENGGATRKRHFGVCVGEATWPRMRHCRCCAGRASYDRFATSVFVSAIWATPVACAPHFGHPAPSRILIACSDRFIHVVAPPCPSPSPSSPRQRSPQVLPHSTSTRPTMSTPRRHQTPFNKSLTPSSSAHTSVPTTASMPVPMPPLPSFRRAAERIHAPPGAMLHPTSSGPPTTTPSLFAATRSTPVSRPTSRPSSRPVSRSNSPPPGSRLPPGGRGRPHDPYVASPNAAAAAAASRQQRLYQPLGQHSRFLPPASRTVTFSDDRLTAATRAADRDLEQRPESALARRRAALNTLAGVNPQQQQAHDNARSSSLASRRAALLARTAASLPVTPPSEPAVPIDDEQQPDDDIDNDQDTVVDVDDDVDYAEDLSQQQHPKLSKSNVPFPSNLPPRSKFPPTSTSTASTTAASRQFLGDAGAAGSQPWDARRRLGYRSSISSLRQSRAVLLEAARPMDEDSRAAHPEDGSSGYSTMDQPQGNMAGASSARSRLEASVRNLERSLQNPLDSWRSRSAYMSPSSSSNDLPALATPSRPGAVRSNNAQQWNSNNSHLSTAGQDGILPSRSSRYGLGGSGMSRSGGRPTVDLSNRLFSSRVQGGLMHAPGSVPGRKTAPASPPPELVADAEMTAAQLWELRKAELSARARRGKV